MSQPIWLGVGNPKPQSRVLKNSMFGHVVDAFDEKTITKIGEVSPYEKRMKAMKEAEKKREERDEEMNKRESEEAPAVGSESNNLGQNQNGGNSTSNAFPANGVVGSSGSESVTSSNQEIDMNGKYTTSQTLLKGGRVVNDDCSFLADVLLQDGKILEVSEKIEEKAGMKVVDASNKCILPGGIDLTTSFGSAPFKGIVQSVDDFQTGSKAALLGGTTLIAYNLEPAIDQSYVQAYDELLVKLAVEKEGGHGVNGVKEGETNGVGGGACCDFVVRVGLTWWSEEVAKELQVLVTEKGTSVCFIPPDAQHDDSTMVDICQVLKRLGVLLIVYPSNPLLSQLLAKDLQDQGFTGPEACHHTFPEEAELASIHRYLSIACQLHLPLYIGGVSCKAGAELVSKKRREGNVVFSEVLLPSLALDGAKVLDADWVTAAHHVTYPPIRMHKNNGHLMLNQLASNDIQVLSSGHSAFSTVQKAYGKDSFVDIPPGIATVQERIEMLWSLAVASGVMSSSCLVACTSALPAKLLNIYPRKGRIATGSDADLLIIDPTKDHEYSKDNRASGVDFNVYAGMRINGAVTSVFKDGRHVVCDGLLKDDVHTGRLISCTATPDVAFSRISILEQSTNGVKAVPREAYDGPISGQGSTSAHSTPSHPAGQRSESFCRPPTRSGGKNMQDTTLSISVDGTYADDPIKCQKLGGYRVNQPPGGRTTQFW